MADFAARISAAKSDADALLALAIELNAALSGAEATVEAMREAERERKAKQVTRTRRHRNATQRDVTSQGVTERDVTAPPSPQVSSSSPEPLITPSFPPPPQQPAEPSADELRLLAAAPEAAEQVRSFLDGMPFARRLGWVTVLLWVMDEGPRLSGAELRKALGDFTAKVVADRWTPTYFRGFCRGVRDELAEEAPTTADAGKVFAAIRSLIAQKQTPGRAVIRYIPRTKVEELGARAVAAYEQVGGADRFLDPDEKIGFLLRDFTNAFQSAAA